MAGGATVAPLALLLAVSLRSTAALCARCRSHDSLSFAEGENAAKQRYFLSIPVRTDRTGSVHSSLKEFLMNAIVSLEETRFNESITVNPQGSIFLGYCYAVLVIAGVLPGDEDLKIGMPDLQVRITVDGAPRIDFPSDVKSIKGEKKRVARYFSASAASREFLTNAVFALPAVSRAVERAERKRSAA